MSSDRDSRSNKRNESVYTQKFRAGKRRTYFFDVRQTKGDEYFLMLTESSRRMDGGYDRQTVVLYKEDLNRFVNMLQETVDHIKNDLMKDYDFDEFENRIIETNEERSEEDDQTPPVAPKAPPRPVEPRKKPFDELDDEDMSW